MTNPMHPREITPWAEHMKERKQKKAHIVKCKTPDAVYEISVRNPLQTVSVVVTLPPSAKRMNESEAVALEERLHNAVERALAPLFTPTKGGQTS